jgi:hypothetical protein
MYYKELYNNLKIYSTESKFKLLGVEVSYYLHGGQFVYHFIHGGTSYLVIESFDGDLDDKILIDLNNEVKKLIRKNKISKILNDD